MMKSKLTWKRFVDNFKSRYKISKLNISSLTINYRICYQNVSHAFGWCCQSQSKGAQQWANDGNLAIGKFFEQWTDKKAWKVHHDVKHADDDCSAGCSHIQIVEQIAEKQSKRGFNASRCQLNKLEEQSRKRINASITDDSSEMKLTNTHIHQANAKRCHPAVASVGGDFSCLFSLIHLITVSIFIFCFSFVAILRCLTNTHAHAHTVEVKH